MQVQQPPQVSIRTNRKKLTGRTRLALWLIIGPTVFLALLFAFFALTRSDWAEILTLTTKDTTPLIIGGLSLVLWLSGLIAGVVLLSARPTETKH
jgi:heme/copper-type cytochrome/quinol oxidase subunit 3